ncbi:MAG: cyanophycin synthetase, partial [Myxococcales bacterium]
VHLVGHAPPVRAGRARRGAGRKQHVDDGAAGVDMLFPSGTPARVPIVSITGTNGKTTTTRLVAHLLGATGLTVGMTSTDGITVGGELVSTGDTTGPGSAGVVLFDPTVDVAVLETAREGIVRRGLGYDWSDVGILTNVEADHLGQDGIESIDDILRIKMVVAERVREGGTLILNAEDPRLAALPAHRRIAKLDRTIVFFALDPQNEVLARHLAAGGRGYTLRGDWLVECEGTTERPIEQAAHLPITLGGAARFQIANALAAVAAARAQGLALETIAPALRSFGAGASNPGRSNLYRLGDRYVLLDYGHNPGALRAICALAAQWRARPATAVLSLPGDRSDELLEACAAEVASPRFRRLILKDDQDRRGRAVGEVPALIERVTSRLQPSLPCQLISDERIAIEHALATAEPRELVVIFTDQTEPLGAWLREQGAEPTDAVPERVSGVWRIEAGEGGEAPGAGEAEPRMAG